MSRTVSKYISLGVGVGGWCGVATTTFHYHTVMQKSSRNDSTNHIQK